MASRGRRDQHIEVQIAQFARLKAAIRLDSGQNLSRFQPVLLRGRQDGPASFESLKDFAVNRRSALKWGGLQSVGDLGAAVRELNPGSNRSS